MLGLQKGYRTNHDIGVQANSNSITNTMDPKYKGVKIQESIAKCQYQGSIANDQYQWVNSKRSISKFQ